MRQQQDQQPAKTQCIVCCCNAICSYGLCCSKAEISTRKWVALKRAVNETCSASNKIQTLQGLYKHVHNANLSPSERSVHQPCRRPRRLLWTAQSCHKRTRCTGALQQRPAPRLMQLWLRPGVCGPELNVTCAKFQGLCEDSEVGTHTVIQGSTTQMCPVKVYHIAQVKLGAVKNRSGVMIRWIKQVRDV